MSYIPRGRTDESSHDYSDDPSELAMKFSREVLECELAYAEQDGFSSCSLKFDYEEQVPIAAVREALALMA